jgi:hypothetical protein
MSELVGPMFIELGKGGPNGGSGVSPETERNIDLEVSAIVIIIIIIIIIIICHAFASHLNCHPQLRALLVLHECYA